MVERMLAAAEDADGMEGAGVVLDSTSMGAEEEAATEVGCSAAAWFALATVIFPPELSVRTTDPEAYDRVGTSVCCVSVGAEYLEVGAAVWEAPIFDA